MSEASPVGLIGIGLMGTAIARRLLAAGFTVIGTDVRAEARDRLQTLGGRPVGTVAEIAQSCATVVLAVFDTAQVEEVTAGSEGLASIAVGERRASIILNTATCEPDRVAALARRLAPQGLALIELPVSGTSDQVARGDGVGLIAGDPVAIAAARSVISAITPRSYEMGDAGNGAKTKLAINHILGLNRAALAEGLVFAERLGLPLPAFLEAAKGSAAYSQIMDVKGAKMIARDFSPHGKVSQSLKDFKMIVAEAHARGQPLPLAEVYAVLMAGCVAAGDGEADNCSIIEELRRRTLPTIAAGETTSDRPA